MVFLLNLPAHAISCLLSFLNQAFYHLTQPARSSLVLNMAADLTRSKAELIAENALLRQQLIVLHRQAKKPRFTPSDRLWFVLLVSRLPHWREVLLIFKPDMLPRWHRQGFRLFWKFKSRLRGGRPPITPEIIGLIQRLASENQLWGAERIRGELLKLGLHVAKGTVQKYLAPARHSRSASQTWSTFLPNHAQAIWACDFLPVIDLFFFARSIFFSSSSSPRGVWSISA